MDSSSQEPQQNLTFNPDFNNYTLLNFNQQNFEQNSQLQSQKNSKLQSQQNSELCSSQIYPQLCLQLNSQQNTPPCNNSQQISPETKPQLKKEITAVVIGYSGSGKTLFVNNMCATQFQSGIAMGRMTTKMQSGQCKYIKSGIFEIWDTPALDRKDKNKTNRKEIRKILQKSNLDVIYVIVPFDPRYEDVTLTNLQEISEMIKRQQKNCCQIVFIISNVDKVSSKDKDSFIDNFSRSIKQLKITNKVILFSNINSNFKNLAQELYNSAKNHSPQKSYQSEQMSSVSENSQIEIVIKHEKDEQNNHQKVSTWYKKWQQFKQIFVRHCNCRNFLLFFIASSAVPILFVLWNYGYVHYWLI